MTSQGTLDPTKTHQVTEFKHKNPLTTLKADPTGRFVAAGAQDLDVQLWQLDDGHLQTLTGHKSWIRSIDFSADGRRLYTACWGGQVKIWNLEGGRAELMQTLQTHQGSARCVRVSPDGQTIATCGNDLLVKVWDIASGEQKHQFEGHQRHVYGVDFHPQGDHLVSQDLMGVSFVWNLKTNQQERTVDASMMTGYDKKFAADMGGARDIRFNADGSQWASAGITKVVNSFAGIQDPIIVVFDWKTGQATRQLKAADKFKGIAWGVRFHPEGFLIGAGAEKSGKGELWFYKTDTDEAFHTFATKSAARGLDLVGNDRLAVAHADGALRVYQMTEPASSEPDDEAKTTPADSEQKEKQ